MAIDSDAVARARAVRVEDELARRGVRLQGKTERVGPCPMCGGADRFWVNTRKQLWGCRGCHPRAGDVIDLVQHLDRCDFVIAVHALAADCGRPEPRPGPTPPAELDTKAHDAKIFRSAMNIWSEAIPIGGTPVEGYLLCRNLEIPNGVSGDVLRYHPKCPFGTDDRGNTVHQPAMVALVRSIRTDEPQAIHRTALRPDGRALKQPSGKTARLSLGPIRGGAIKLTDNADVTLCLGIGEGIETVLSMRRMPEFGLSPIWSLVADSGVRDFPVLYGIETLWIAVDNDKPDQRGRSAGNEAALACSKRWVAAAREVFRVIPDQVGDDLNDVTQKWA